MIILDRVVIVDVKHDLPTLTITCGADIPLAVIGSI